jgi:hypothetical protein
MLTSAQAAAQQLETIALRTQSHAEVALLDRQGTPTEFVREIMATAQEIETLSHILAAPLPGLGESAE